MSRFQSLKYFYNRAILKKKMLEKKITRQVATEDIGKPREKREKEREWGTNLEVPISLFFIP